MIGDIIGPHGLETLETKLPTLINEHRIDFVTVNGENAADGFGMTESDFRRIIAAGVDVVTSGNHIWEKRDFWQIMESEERMLRPANYAGGASLTPGKGHVIIEKNGVKWLVINLQGRELMSAIDCPFQSFDRIVGTGSANTAPSSIVIVDFHA
jgi:calcineurin-like phosphoesterase